MATAKIVELTDENTCKICEQALAKYSCPRCNINYCSLSCYQSEKHLECSEGFYQECVLKELSLEKKSSEQSKAEMMEILQRMHESNKIGDADVDDDLDSDDEQYEDLSERLAGVDLDDADNVWQKLTEDERQEFVAFLQSKDISKLVPMWKPWWNYSNENKVVEIGANEQYKEKCPKIFGSIKDFSTITSKPPNDCVKYNLINVLAAYVFTVRYFNGEHFDFAREAASCVSLLSLNLKSNQNFSDYEGAVKSVEQECLNISWIMTDAENMTAMNEDLERILNGSDIANKNYYVLCSLSDLHNLMKAAINTPQENTNTSEFLKQFKGSNVPPTELETKERLKLHVKKLKYYLSYSKDCLQT